MRKVRSLNNPIIFTWAVVDRDDPAKKIEVQFHPEGMISLKGEKYTLDVPNAQILAVLIQNHILKKFTTPEGIKREFVTIRSALRPPTLQFD